VEVTVSSTNAVGVVATNAFTSVIGETTTPLEPPTTDGSHAPVQAPLARTGSDQLPLMVFGFAVVGAGLALSVVARRLRTTQ
jgi:hypothetical protein